MDMSDDESSDAGSSIAPARPDASYWQENYGYDPRDETLLKFDALVTEEIEEKGKESPINRCTSPGEISLGDEPDHEKKVSIAYTIAPDMQNVPFDCDIHRFDEQDINKLLEAIQDPKEWIQNGRMFTKIVSKAIPQPEDSEQLHIRLDELLRERRALPRGVCPIRESIYGDCFNELIRQVALGSDANCGHLLLRCRDELHHTKGAYSRLFESSESFSMRKSLRRNPSRLMEGLAFAVEELEISKKECADLTDELKRVTRSISEEAEKFDKLCKDELDYLNQNNIRLKKILDVVTKPGGYRWSMSQGTLGAGAGKTQQQDPKPRQSEAVRPSEAVGL